MKPNPKIMTAGDFKKFLIRLNLTTKEISFLTGQSKTTVNKYTRQQPPLHWRYVCIGIETEMIRKREAKREAEQR